jgi:hypothetical protein
MAAVTGASLARSNSVGGSTSTEGVYSPAGNNKDVIVDDAEFLHAEQILLAYIEQIVESATDCAGVLKKVLEWGALKDERICPVLTNWASNMMSMANRVNDIGKDLRGTSDAFVHRVDEIDSFFY